MTWTKLGDEFSDECANVDLSDYAYRTHVEAIAWIYRVERTDCKIPKHLVKRFTGSHMAEAGIAELLFLGWWRDVADHFEVIHQGDVIRQSIAAQQSKRQRDKNAQAAARQRAKAKAQSVDDVSAYVIPDTDRQTNKHLEPAESVNDPRFWKTPEEMNG